MCAVVALVMYASASFVPPSLCLPYPAPLSVLSSAVLCCPLRCRPRGGGEQSRGQQKRRGGRGARGKGRSPSVSFPVLSASAVAASALLCAALLALPHHRQLRLSALHRAAEVGAGHTGERLSVARLTHLRCAAPTLASLISSQLLLRPSLPASSSAGGWLCLCGRSRAGACRLLRTHSPCQCGLS